MHACITRQICIIHSPHSIEIPSRIDSNIVPILLLCFISLFFVGLVCCVVYLFVCTYAHACMGMYMHVCDADLDSSNVIIIYSAVSSTAPCTDAKLKRTSMLVKAAHVLPSTQSAV